jgi:2-polyprenyl-3-methyl-5-hydroxy-6-metoxy-1,4-benzoquinol methylase
MTKSEIQGRAKQAARILKDDFILNECKGKSVLDVGCIGQDRNFGSPNWLHNKVKSVAKNVDGVDILTEQILELKKLGYSMLSIKELEEKNVKYDVVLISDVIEHVNDPVAFLSYYAAFLSPSGRMLVSTPNSNRSLNFVNILFNNNYTVNEEHTFWFCPRTFAEVTVRSKLTIKEFYWADNYFDFGQIKGVYQRFKISLSNFLFRLRSNFSPNMMFVLIKEK